MRMKKWERKTRTMKKMKRMTSIRKEAEKLNWCVFLSFRSCIIVRLYEGVDVTSGVVQVAVKSQASGQTWRTNNGHESLPPADDE